LSGDKWLSAETAGDLGPKRQQAILDRRRREAEALCNIVRVSALETLADEVSLTRPAF
jgi:hypothetical protein